ncbi:MAG: DUF1579 family protein, partial [Candidatus Promineifilaceae bacterium]|nr:DUF1579 family protein [Candidatus Promineifilaceae bacterium]
TLAYTWSFDSQPQDGLLLIPASLSTSGQAVWIDSWHMQSGVMICQAALAGSVLSLQGSYAAPPGPDWAWRIELESAEPDSLQLRMFNITPDGEEALAVDALFSPIQT